MKKRMLALFLIGMMLLTMPAYAENMLNVSFRCEITEDENLNYRLIIRGNYDDGESMVTLSVKKHSSGETVYADQVQTGKDGNFAFEVLLKQNGDFTVRVNSSESNRIQQSDISLLKKEDYDAIIAVFNREDATAEDYEEQIELHGADLGLDMIFYQKAENSKTEIFKQMLQQKGNFTLSKIPSIFTASVILGIINGNEQAAFKDEIFQYYIGTNFVLDETYRSLYESYCEAGEAMKQKVWEKICSGTLNSCAEVCERFYPAVVQCAFSELDAKELDQFILKNKDCFDFQKYESFSSAKKAKVLAVLKSKPFSSISELENNYKTAVAELEKSTGNTSFPSGNGGSGKPSVSYPQTQPSATQTPAPSKDTSFIDLNEVQWAEEAIRYLQSKGVVSGKAERIFAPNDPVTRAEFCKILVNSYQLLDAAATCNFTDVSEEEWYYLYVSSAYCYGIINGYEDNYFRGDKPVTREEMVTILYRLLQKKRLIDAVSSVTNSFRDFEDISDYAKNAVLILSSAGYVQGAGEEQFLPKNIASRAEVCVLIYNTLKGGNR